MRRIIYNFFALTIAFLVGLTTFAFWYFAPVKIQTESSSVLDIQADNLTKQILTSGEILLSENENAYNPIPSPNGFQIAYVRIGKDKFIGGLGRSTLTSEIAVMDADGNLQARQSLANAFLYGWTSDGKSLNCFRDGNYSTVSLDGKILAKGRLPENLDSSFMERVAFLPNENSVLWLQNYFTNIKNTEISQGAYSTTSEFVHSAIQSSKGEIAKYNSLLNTDALLIPSPDGRFFAIAPSFSRGGGNSNLLIYDKQKASWTNLGKFIIHPYEDWDYIKPSWNPWFADSSRLVFATAAGITISSPDGKSKQIISKPKQASGLAVPSPDGNIVAYATFDPKPMKESPDLKFWGGSQIWIVPIAANAEAHPVTHKNEDTTLDLRWLNNHELVFDRIANEQIYKKARLWKVNISQ